VDVFLVSTVSTGQFPRPALRGPYWDGCHRRRSVAQAKRFALQYLWLSGKLSVDVPEIEGFIPTVVIFKDGGAVACNYASIKGRKFRVYNVRTGRRLGPEHPHLASLLTWERVHGWIHPIG
jgi:hypothetical protein